MAIANPTDLTQYCEGTNIRIEWQNPNRDEKRIDWSWSGFETTETPVQLLRTTTLGALIETVVIDLSVGSTKSGLNILAKNSYYTFVITGVVPITAAITADGCWEINTVTESVTPSNRLTIVDEIYPELFKGSAEYDPLNHVYYVGYIGDGIVPTFRFSGGNTGLITINIYPNNYQLQILKENPSPTPPTILFDETKANAFESINLACGGDCPTRTTFQCECQGFVHCKWDNQNGSIVNIFSGEK